MNIRPLQPGERSTVAQVFAGLSDRARRLRFHGPKPRLSDADLEFLSATDGRDHVALVGVEDDRPVAICRFVREKDDASTAEFACAVADEFQGHGIGTAVAHELAASARSLGVQRFRAVLLSTNRPALQLVKRLGRVEHTRLEGPTLELLVRLEGA